MTPPAWDAPVIPQCPCCFRLICSSDRQAGINSLFREGRLTSPEQCVFFSHRAALHRATTGREPPARAEDLLAQLAERKAIQSEAGPA